MRVWENRRGRVAWETDSSNLKGNGCGVVGDRFQLAVGTGQASDFGEEQSEIIGNFTGGADGGARRPNRIFLF